MERAGTQQHRRARRWTTVDRTLSPAVALLVGWGLVAGCDDPERPARGTRIPHPSIPAVQFTADILPILEARCLSCHGEDTREGELRLDTRLGATERRLGGARAIDPGSPDQSLFVTTAESEDPAVRMPPEGTALTERELLLVRRWIEEGAPYAEHWAYTPPTRPEVPSGATSPVDAFVDATLTRVGVTASGRADPAAQLRRVSLVLTGLPPSLEELDAFLADPSDAAYEAAVDRMLSSDRHAEHLARDWLDHVGYSDSNGMYMDVERDVWAYREWVIQAFADDMPLDRFLTLQLAGDLGAAPSSDDQLATGLLRLHRTTEEGGIYGEEFRALYAAERATTVANTMLGLTFQCARCHTHRYDPLTQRDFYRLTACFNRVGDQGGTPPLVPFDAVPVLVAMGPLQRAELASVRSQLAAARASLRALDLGAELASFEATLGSTVRFDPAGLASARTEEGTTLAITGPGTLSATGASPHTESWDVVLNRVSPIHAVRLSDITSRLSDRPTTLSEVRLRVESANARRTIDLEIRFSPSSGVSGDGLAAIDGTTTNGLEVPDGGEVLLLPAGPIVLAPGEELHLSIDMRRGNGSAAARLRIETSADPLATFDDALRAIHATPRASRSTTDQSRLTEHFARFHGSAEANALAATVAALGRLETELSITPHTRVMRDDDPSRVTHVLARGDFFRPLEEVSCGIPVALAGASDPNRRDRADVAAWMVSEDNPLTARVLVNRLFQVIFGRGIVSSPQDLGTRGGLPSHPLLLDWLATELVSSGWDARHILRLLVTSEAFRRSSVDRPDVAAFDPGNELLARGPRRRLDAEVLRDQALFISGLLVERLGGPSVRPYHPRGLYEQLIDFDDSPMRTYRTDRAPERMHRRGLYTFWRRGTLLPSLSLLDAPDRLGPVPRREATITPTQALALMNEPLFVEAARALAERARREEADVDAAIASMFRRATARPSTAEEAGILRAQYEDELALARADVSVLAVLAIGEADRDSAGDPAAHAAMTAVARTILTLSETITEE